MKTNIIRNDNKKKTTINITKDGNINNKVHKNKETKLGYEDKTER